MTDETIFLPPSPDRFEHESPLRAFTEFRTEPGGMYAIGKGLRPSVRHLTNYLDAIERKEGWRLIQLLVDDNGEFRSAVFRREPPPALWRGTIDGHLAFATRKLGETFEPVDLGEGGGGAADTQGIVDFLSSIDPDEECPTPDPINPPHYGGTACAEIGERLTPNAYQTLKYCWRLGEKDDPVVELGKAIWYWKREIDLYADRPVLPKLDCPGFDFMGRIADRSRFTRNIAQMLWLGFKMGMRLDHRVSILEALEEQRFHYSDDDYVGEGHTTGLAV